MTVKVSSLPEPIEFTDTDGDESRLAMKDGKLCWYLPDENGGWKPWQDGPFRLNKQTGTLSGREGRATVQDLAAFLVAAAA